MAEPALDPNADPNADPGDPKGDPKGDPPVDNVVWPDNWREGIAGADDKDGKRLTRLGRFDQPSKIFDSFLEIETKYKSSDIRAPFPEADDDDVKATWRKDNGIPAKAEGYLDGLPDGLEVSDADKAGMTTLADAMHGVHAPPDVVHAAMGAWYKHVENSNAERAELDVADKKTTDDELHELYGADFRRNINDLTAWLDSGGEEVKDLVLSSRAADGMPLGSHPVFMKFMIGQMRLIDPLVTVPGLGPGDKDAAGLDEIEMIEKRIREDNKGYRADKKMQDRYLELLDWRDKRKK